LHPSISLHVFIEPFTPPVPLLFCLVAAGFAVVASFILVGYFSRNPRNYSGYPKINVLKWAIVRSVTGTGTILLIQLTSVLLFVLVVSAGFLGNPNPIYNLAPTFIWVIWWVGVAYASAFLGDVWALLNPWKITFSWVETFWRRINSGRSLLPIMQYPEKAGVWPALFLFLVFAWVENVYSDSIIPARISQMILVYSGFTWVGMILFGKDAWIQHGEAFSLAFGLFARFAPTEVRLIAYESTAASGKTSDSNLPGTQTKSAMVNRNERQINLRPFAAGLLDTGKTSTSEMCFVLLLLATVTFDGFTATLPWVNIQNSAARYMPNIMIISTVGLILSALIFVGVYWGFGALMSLTGERRLNALDLGKAFVYTLIPIALAYHVAHFLLFLLIQGQLIVPLASDPFGFGWDLLGTANYRLNFQLVSPDIYWFLSVIAIVAGHIIAVFLSHVIALRLHSSRRQALRSQYPMLVLMVGYTTASLWIITQPMYMPTM
jgi:hypothetical protein